ncbi:ATP-binding protein [Haloferula sp. BvORR071]|uniref:sensor histidine kinase n=1 Tax=Haloferula sp. BvORR071 TaxID=1396141 RepID=UPI000697DF72|nr:ATP-binding protein [Haloferula sp. BvORR071]
MFTDSIRWRMQLWLGILLLGLLVAFGGTSWQLEKTQRIRRLDDELAKRAAALGVGVRGGSQPFEPGRMNRPDGGPGGGPDDLAPFVDFGPGSDSGPGPGPGPGSGRGGPNSKRPPRPPEMDDEYRGEFSEDFGDSGRRGPSRSSGKKIPTEVEAMFPADGAEGYYYAVWIGRSGTQKNSANAPAGIPLPASDGRNTQTQFRDRAGVREAFHFTERGECVLAGRPVHSDLAGMKAYGLRLSITGLAVLVVGLGGGWILTSRSMRPIQRISASARRISEGNLSERIPVGSSGNELNQLAGVLNSTFSRLEDSFAQQKRFTADASHELRTPLAVLITETQSALSRERSAEDYREVLTGNLETARQMKRLAEALLELARVDAGSDPSGGLPFDLSEVATSVVTKLKPLAEARATKLSTSLKAANTSGSPERLTLVASNLIENAIHHGKHGGHIDVATFEEDGRVILKVSDDGPGISAEDLPHLFERFYRADKSRTGANGRYGLGLAICKGLVEAEGGTISVESRKGEGASFTVSLPLAS